MSQFICRVGTSGGDIREIALQADTEGSVRRELADSGYHIFSVRRSFQLASLASAFRRGPGRIKSTDFIIFNQELASLLKAGLPLLQSLNVMLERMSNEKLKHVLADVRDKVKSGTSLSEAFRSHGELFPQIYSASLLAGEKSGSLEEVLRRYVQHLKLTGNHAEKGDRRPDLPIFLVRGPSCRRFDSSLPRGADLRRVLRQLPCRLASSDRGASDLRQCGTGTLPSHHLGTRLGRVGLLPVVSSGELARQGRSPEN